MEPTKKYTKKTHWIYDERESICECSMVPSQIRPTSSSHELATNTSILTVVNPVFISAKKNARYVHCKKVLYYSNQVYLKALLRDDADDTYDERAPEFSQKATFCNGPIGIYGRKDNFVTAMDAVVHPNTHHGWRVFSQ